MTKALSPRCPGENLAECVGRLEKLYEEAKRGLVDAGTIALAIGYKSLNGGSRTTIAALSGYGLIEREGDKHKVSDEGFKIIRPLSDDSKRESLQLAAYRPAVFAQIRKQHGDSSEAVLTRMLLHEGFTEEGAPRAARVYKENVAFLEQSGANQDANDEDQSELELPDLTGKAASAPAPETPRSAAALETPKVEILAPSGKWLAQYQIPLGANQAQLTFTGEELVPEDFDALIDYVEIFKKQFLRKQQRATSGPKSSEDPTGYEIFVSDEEV